jgi:hypothetical protein
MVATRAPAGKSATTTLATAIGAGLNSPPSTGSSVKKIPIASLDGQATSALPAIAAPADAAASSPHSLFARGCRNRPLNYGCEKGYCWQNCTTDDVKNPGFWCWAANGLNGKIWSTCKTDEDCELPKAGQCIRDPLGKCGYMCKCSC